MRNSLKYLFFTIAMTLMFQPAWAKDLSQEMRDLMIDLPGYKAGKPESMAMLNDSMKMLTASRTYTKDSAVLNTTFVTGAGTESFAQMGDINVSTADMRAKTRNIDGFKVVTNYDIPGKSGGVFVWLGSGNSDQSALVISFQGMDDNQALDLAKKFDWQAFQTLAKQALQ